MFLISEVAIVKRKSNVLTIIKIVTDIVATVLIIRALLNSRKDAK